MLEEIAIQWTLNLVEQLNNEIHENWYWTNIDETTNEYFTLSKEVQTK